MISPVMQAILELEAPVKKLRCALRSCQDFSQGVSINGGHPKMDDGKKTHFSMDFFMGLLPIYGTSHMYPSKLPGFTFSCHHGAG